MTNNPIYRIQNPCNVSWQSMDQTSHGRFCQECQKEVIDFCGMQRNEVDQKLKTDQNVCGRFELEQLYVPKKRLASFRRHMYIMAAALFIAPAGLQASPPAISQHHIQAEVTCTIGDHHDPPCPKKKRKRRKMKKRKMRIMGNTIKISSNSSYSLSDSGHKNKSTKKKRRKR